MFHEFSTNNIYFRLAHVRGIQLKLVINNCFFYENKKDFGFL